MPIGEVPIEDSPARTSGVPELDRVLGGGLVPGAAILLAGEPGVGKSHAAPRGRRPDRAPAPAGVLYVTGEESAAQVRMRADRTGGIQDELYLAAETDLGAVLGHVEEVKPTLLVIDSVQTISAGDVDGVPGGVTQVKEVSAALIRMAKLRNITLVIIGHVTKDGTIAGPRVLEHLVDVVLHFEGERTSRLRMVRAVKNRYGPVDEVGCFDLSAEGIEAITDPTGLFLDSRHGPVPGTCVAVAIEGRRPLLSEVQALVTHTAGERPRRTTSGVDSSRVAMIIAVLQQHAGIRLHNHDVFVSSVGGARVTEPQRRRRHRAGLASAGWASRWPATWSPSASSACPGSSAGCATSTRGWPRPAGWASGSRSCPGARRAPPGTLRRGAGAGCSTGCGWSRADVHTALRDAPVGQGRARPAAPF